MTETYRYWKLMGDITLNVRIVGHHGEWWRMKVACLALKIAWLASRIAGMRFWGAIEY